MQHTTRHAAGHLRDTTDNALARAIVQTLAYADIFDYPLTLPEIQRYLIGLAASRDSIDEVLVNCPLLGSCLASRDGFFTLAGRESIVDTRIERQAEAARLWPHALRYGHIIAGVPFVRMVAITGELAMDNVQPASDIDYFIVTEPDRLWLCRLLVIGVVRVAALRRVQVCPNFLVSERALVMQERNLYSAHEIAQMIPVTGEPLYQRLRSLNGWAADYLPNAAGPPQNRLMAARGRPLRALGERMLRGRVGARLERWEMRRKVRKLSAASGTLPEASFSPDWCKGHVSGHEGRIMATFNARWRALEEKLP